MIKTQKHLITTPNNLKQTLEKYGVAIIPDVIDNQEQKSMLDGAWNFLTHATSSLDTPIKKNNPSTWKSFWELYPKHSMLIQQWGIGHSQYLWDLRQNPKIVDIFSKLWDTDSKNLLVSFDGASFGFPHENTKRGYFRGNEWYHFDQRLSDSSFQCVQSWVTALDVNPGDATLTVLEGSHLLHEKFAKKFADNIKKPKDDWYKLDKDQVDWLLKEGCKIHDITCKAGSMVFWDSRTCHAGKEAIKSREGSNFRCVGYMCYTPRKMATSAMLKKKQKAFNDMRTTSHWPHKPKLFPLKPRTYGKPLPKIPNPPKPEVNKLGRRLAGFDK